MAREPVCVAERGHRARGAGAPEEPAGSLQNLSTHTATQWLLACATVPLPCIQRGTLQKCLRTSGEASRVLRRALSSKPCVLPVRVLRAGNHKNYSCDPSGCRCCAPDPVSSRPLPLALPRRWRRPARLVHSRNSTAVLRAASTVMRFGSLSR